MNPQAKIQDILTTLRHCIQRIESLAEPKCDFHHLDDWSKLPDTWPTPGQIDAIQNTANLLLFRLSNQGDAASKIMEAETTLQAWFKLLGYDDAKDCILITRRAMNAILRDSECNQFGDSTTPSKLLETAIKSKLTKSRITILKNRKMGNHSFCWNGPPRHSLQVVQMFSRQVLNYFERNKTIER